MPQPIAPLDHIFSRHIAAQANPNVATIRAWNLPPHLQDICIAFAEVSGVEVRKRDVGKWSAGARDLSDFKPPPTRAEIESCVKRARERNFPMVWPGAVVNTLTALRNERRETVAAVGNQPRIVNWTANPDGSMTPVFEARQ